ncbi:MAG: hypothetical protein JWQ03_3133 [Variovorax sp.]|nr:hypothetical protein [Variovorax sp.]
MVRLWPDFVGFVRVVGWVYAHAGSLAKWEWAGNIRSRPSSSYQVVAGGFNLAFQFALGDLPHLARRSR